MNAGDRSHWLEPSPPIAVDGDEPPTRPRVLPDPEAPDAPGAETCEEDVHHDYEDGLPASHSS